MSNEPLFSVWSGTFRLFGVEVRCHVLNNRQRVIDAEDMYLLLAAMEKPVAEVGELAAFARWQQGMDQ